MFQVVPGFGSTGGGTAVVIFGTGFVPGASVTVGGHAATNVTVVDGGTIHATVPAGTAGRADVTVRNTNGNSTTLAAAFLYIVAPVLDRVDPQAGPTAGFTFVTLSGTNLDSVQGVSFGDAPGAIYSQSSTTMFVQSPPHAAGLVGVTVSNPAASFTLPNAFTFVSDAQVTATAAASATAAAQQTAVAQATQSAFDNQIYATATALAQQPGRSPDTAVSLGPGGSLAGSFDAAAAMKWYSLPVQAGRLYRVFTDCTAAQANDLMFLWQPTGAASTSAARVVVENRVARDLSGSLVNIGFGDQSCGITFVAPTSGTFYVSIFGFPGVSYTIALTESTTTVNTPTTTPVPPTATFTRSPTLTATVLPTVVKDAFEPDDSVAAARSIAVGGAAQTHSFHNATDIDFVTFTTDGTPGFYTVQTLNMTGHGQTLISILSASGSQVLDPTTGDALTAFADTTTGEFGAARVGFAVSGANLNRTFVVRIINANPTYYGTYAGQPVGYQFLVKRESFTPTPTPRPGQPTNTSTATATSTRTPAPPDAYEPDNGRAAADAVGAYNLTRGISHAGTQPLTADRSTGPRHTFDVAGDEDWLALKLPVLVPGQRLVVRAYDTTTRGALRTSPQLFLYRPAPTGATRLAANVRRSTAANLDGLIRERRAESCTDIPGQVEGACFVVTFNAELATRYTGQTWYLRIRNLESDLSGGDIAYALDVQLVAPSATNTPTSTRTVTPVSAGVVGTPTNTPTETPEPVRAKIGDGGGTFDSSNGGSSAEIPRGFAPGHDSVDFNYDTGDGNQTQTPSPARRAQADATGQLTLRRITASALDSDTGDPISQFLLPVGFCVRYTWDELQALGVDQETVQPYFIDRLTGERKTNGVTRTKYTPATTSSPGEICFKTTHFSDFEMSGQTLPGPTRTVTPTPTATPRSSVALTFRYTFPRIFQRGSGW